jgi:serine/threonine protein kinase
MSSHSEASLSRAVWSRQERRSLHRARNWSKADVSLLEWPPDSGQNVVVKDLARCPLWFRLSAGRRLLKREAQALRALDEVENVPRLVAVIDADAVAMTHCAGRQIVEWTHDSSTLGALPIEVLSKLEALLREVHRRGVTHGDLHGDNILVDESGDVSLIDWATGCDFGPHPRGLKCRTFEEWRSLDERALAKLKKRHAPDLLSERERDLLENGGSRAYRAVKSLRRARQKLRGKKPESSTGPNSTGTV